MPLPPGVPFALVPDDRHLMICYRFTKDRRGINWSETPWETTSKHW